jgi:hypothetical protein
MFNDSCILALNIMKPLYVAALLIKDFPRIPIMWWGVHRDLGDLNMKNKTN